MPAAELPALPRIVALSKACFCATCGVLELIQAFSGNSFAYSNRLSTSAIICLLWAVLFLPRVPRFLARNSKISPAQSARPGNALDHGTSLRCSVSYRY